MFDPHTNFYYPKTIGYWVTSTEYLITFPLFETIAAHVPCHVTSNGDKNSPHFKNHWPQFAYSLRHFQGATKKIKPYVRLKTHGVENRRRFSVENRNRLSERVSCENDSDFRLRKSASVFDSDYNVFYFEVDFQRHAIDRNSCDWFKFIVFVWFVYKQCRIGE